jgi:hypothetical protein
VAVDEVDAEDGRRTVRTNLCDPPTVGVEFLKAAPALVIAGVDLTSESYSGPPLELVPARSLPSGIRFVRRPPRRIAFVTRLRTVRPPDLVTIQESF